MVSTGSVPDTNHCHLSPTRLFSVVFEPRLEKRKLGQIDLACFDRGRPGRLCSILRPRAVWYHGVFAPNSHHRARVTLAKRGKGNKAKAPDARRTPGGHDLGAAPQARVFRFEIEFCEHSGGVGLVIHRESGPSKRRLSGAPCVRYVPRY
jgi:hypothetical protein